MSEKFIVMRSSNLTAPIILKAANTYEEAYKAMIKDFVEIGEYRQPKIYSRYEYGAKALECTDCCDYRWTIEKVDFEDEKPLSIEDQLPDEIIAVVYDWKGCVEENYLFTPEDFGKFVGDNEEPLNLIDKINRMRAGQIVDFAISADKTFIAWIIKKCPENPMETAILSFLMGANNDDAMDMISRNYDLELSPIDNINRYRDWYYKFEKEESSKEIIDVLLTNPIYENLMKIDGGCVPEFYIDTLYELRSTFNEKSEEYKVISDVITVYKPFT